MNHRISLEEAQKKLSEAFCQIDFSQNRRILVNTPTATGKTRSAAQLCARAVKEGISCLILVPMHVLGKEWEDHLTEAKLKKENIVRLYGQTHADVGCIHQEVAERWLKNQHGQLFRQRYCNQKCKQYKDCLYIETRSKAEKAKVLIATHSHLSHSDFYLKGYNSNRKLVIIDELIQLSKETRYRNEIKQLSRALEWISSNQTNSTAKGMAKTKKYEEKRRIFHQMVKDLEESLDKRKNYQLPEMKIGKKMSRYLHNEIRNYYQKNYKIQVREKSILNSLIDLTQSAKPPKLKYNRKKDCLVANWVPSFHPESTVIILSANAKLNYLKLHPDPEYNNFELLDERMDNWEIDYDWVKAVQMISITGGRRRLVRDKKFQENVKSSIDRILDKHTKTDRIALVCAKGTKDGAKDQFINLLGPRFEKHERKLKSIEAKDLSIDSLPDGKDVVPVIHYGIKGINILDRDNFQYDVIIEITGFYISSNDLCQKLNTFFDRDTPLEEEDIEPNEDYEKFNCLGGKKVDLTINSYKVKRPENEAEKINKWLKLAHEIQEKGEISQTEGRFIRQSRKNKKKMTTIYRFHKANIRPYPKREDCYKSWVKFRIDCNLPGELEDPDISVEKVKNLRQLLSYLQTEFGSKPFTRHNLTPLFPVRTTQKNYLGCFKRGGLIAEYADNYTGGAGKKKSFKLTDMGRNLCLPE